MIIEVSSTSKAPYSSVVLVKAFFANGRVSIGSGVLVGKNDVLTATHVIYDPSRGGYASSIQIIPGADYSGLDGVIESAPFGVLSHGSITAWPQRVFADSNNNSTSFDEIPWDIALIGLSRPVGLEIGWFGLAVGKNFNQPAKEIGYPSNGTGMMMGDSYAFSSNGALISAYSQERSALLGPGSSGGPLYIDTTPFPSVLGIKSSGNSAVNYWADIDFLYDDIIAAINQNDQLVGGSRVVVGTVLSDRFHNLPGSNVIDGLSGIDTVQYQGAFNAYRVFGTGSSQTVVVPTGQTQIGDVLTSVERLVFSDRQLAFDTGVQQSAGQAILLLGAVLPGQLALDISKRELLGNVIELFDQGFTLEELAGAVLRLPIWDVLTQKANPTAADIATYLVQNIDPSATAITVGSAIRQMQSESTQTQGTYLTSLVMSEQAQMHIDLIGISQTGLPFY
jgi:V8-like Glu-specific endopeptidase